MEMFCKNLPKVELHAHLSGSISTACLLRILRDQGQSTSLLEDFIITDESKFHLATAFSVFKSVHAVMNNEKIIKEITGDVISDFADDNVRYLELRTTPRACPTTGMTRRGYVDAVVTAIEESRRSRDDIIVKLLLSIDRRRSLEEALDTVNMAAELRDKSDGIVVGIDFSGDPGVNNATTFIPALQLAKENGLKLAVHLAEVPNVEEVYEVLQIGVDRIGHGTCLLEENGGSKKISDFVHKNAIPIELCLTCNKKCGTVTDLEKHHFKYWYDNKHPLTISTDDKGVFKTTLSREYVLAASTFQLSKADLWKLSYDSIDLCFSAQATKDYLRKYWLENQGHLLDT